MNQLITSVKSASLARRRAKQQREYIMIQYALKRDLLLADRKHEDAQIKVKRNREDWDLQMAMDKELEAL